MALTWVEDGESRQATIFRRGKKATSTLVKSFKVFGTSDDSVLHAAVNAEVTANGQYWQYPGISDVKLMAESYSVSYLGDDAWQVTINYAKDGAEYGSDPQKRVRSFDTTGGTQHITQACSVGFGSTLDFEKRYPSTALNMSGAIGVDSNGVNGVDIVVPQLQWQETYDVPSAYISGTYIRGLASVTGTTNASNFRGFLAGEVLFLGCTGSQEWDDQKGLGPWSLSYRFVASKNVTGQTIGSISGIEKRGHEYLWVRYEDTVSGSSLLKQPKAVYVSKVYKDSEFSLLGIGTT